MNYKKLLDLHNNNILDANLIQLIDEFIWSKTVHKIIDYINSVYTLDTPIEFIINVPTSIIDFDWIKYFYILDKYKKYISLQSDTDVSLKYYMHHTVPKYIKLSYSQGSMTLTSISCNCPDYNIISSVYIHADESISKEIYEMMYENMYGTTYHIKDTITINMKRNMYLKIY